MTHAKVQTVQLGKRRVDYRLIDSRRAQKLRVRIGPNGVEVVKPAKRKPHDVADFLLRNESWILNQLARTERLGGIRRQDRRPTGEILFRGRPTRVRIEPVTGKRRENRVSLQGADIVIQRGPHSRTPVDRSLENWLREQAREDIGRCLVGLTRQLKRRPNRVYVMNQRTKWGNCSHRGNLSFNWRLIFAPRNVLEYIVAHEAVHLVVMNHSAKFWLLLQSVCPSTMQSRRWLEQEGHRLLSAA